MKADRKPTTQEQIKSIEEIMLAYICCAFDLLEDAFCLFEERKAIVKTMEDKKP
jgi:hypothetical protein